MPVSDDFCAVRQLLAISQKRSVSDLAIAVVIRSVHGGARRINRRRTVDASAALGRRSPSTAQPQREQDRSFGRIGRAGSRQGSKEEVATVIDDFRVVETAVASEKQP